LAGCTLFLTNDYAFRGRRGTAAHTSGRCVDALIPVSARKAASCLTSEAALLKDVNFTWTSHRFDVGYAVKRNLRPLSDYRAKRGFMKRPLQDHDLRTVSDGLRRLQRRIRVALANEPGDLVLTGGQVVNVFTGQVQPANVVVADGWIAGVGPYDWPARE